MSSIRLSENMCIALVKVANFKVVKVNVLLRYFSVIASLELSNTWHGYKSTMGERSVSIGAQGVLACSK